MVVARVQYPPTVVSVSQTAMAKSTHVLHMVSRRTDPLDVEPDPDRWPAQFKTMCGKHIAGCPVTFRPTRPCDICSRVVTLGDCNLVSQVLLDSDIEEWMTMIMERARRYKIPRPPLEEALDRYLLPL